MNMIVVRPLAGLVLALPLSALAANFTVAVTPNRILVSASGGPASNCRVSVDISHVVNGARVTEPFVLEGLVVPAQPGPVAAFRAAALVDPKAESAVTATCQ
jgi:hypothetical protein